MNIPALDYYSEYQLNPPTPLDMVREFALIMGQPLYVPYEPLSDLEQMRFRLLIEEVDEVGSEIEPASLLKELADLVYVTYGYAATYGWDLDEAVRRVHASNLSKLDDNGKPIFREDGKVIKGPNYKKPDLTDLV